MSLQLLLHAVTYLNYDLPVILYGLVKEKVHVVTPWVTVRPVVARTGTGGNQWWLIWPQRAKVAIELYQLNGHTRNWANY